MQVTNSQIVPMGPHAFPPEVVTKTPPASEIQNEAFHLELN